MNLFQFQIACWWKEVALKWLIYQWKNHMWMVCVMHLRLDPYSKVSHGSDMKFHIKARYGFKSGPCLRTIVVLYKWPYKKLGRMPDITSIETKTRSIKPYMGRYKLLSESSLFIEQIKFNVDHICLKISYLCKHSDMCLILNTLLHIWLYTMIRVHHDCSISDRWKPPSHAVVLGHNSGFHFVYLMKNMTTQFFLSKCR